MRGGLVLASLLLAAAPARAEENDLRDIRVGMAVSELPAEGYAGFTCMAAAGTRPATWAEYRACPAEPETGWRELRFRYEEAANGPAMTNPRNAGTRVGGQPVRLSLLISDAGRVEGLRIRTDVAAKLFERRRAFLFGEQVKSRYGEAGWACTEGAPGPEEEPVGGVFVREHCTKVTPTRQFILERWLFKRPDEDLQRFSSGSEVTILYRPG